MSNLQEVRVKFQKDTLAVIEYHARQRGISNTDFLSSAVRLVDLITPSLQSGAKLLLELPDGSFERIVFPVK